MELSAILMTASATAEKAIEAISAKAPVNLTDTEKVVRRCADVRTAASAITFPGNVIAHQDLLAHCKLYLHSYLFDFNKNYAL